MESDSDLLELLKDAGNGLLFPSEIDAPFEIKTWSGTKEKPITPSSILELTGNKPDKYIEEISLDNLFSTPTMEQDWHSPEDKARVVRFRKLENSIISNLKDAKVYRCGKINIDVFIVGRLPSGNIMCISTKLLQT